MTDENLTQRAYTTVLNHFVARFSDLWEEAIFLKNRVREIWARVDGAGQDS